MKRLKEVYNEKVIVELKKKLGLTSNLSVPRLEKISINIGAGEAVNDSKIIDQLKDDLVKITGQMPQYTKAKKSIAGFKLRQGQVIGLKVTLRKKRMYDFLERLIHVVFPRIRDFRGLDGNSFDGHGNYNLGIKEQIVFPEIDYDKVVKLHPMQITIVTSAKNDNHAKELLALLGFPFKENDSK